MLQEQIAYIKIWNVLSVISERNLLEENAHLKIRSGYFEHMKSIRDGDLRLIMNILEKNGAIKTISQKFNDDDVAGLSLSSSEFEFEILEPQYKRYSEKIKKILTTHHVEIFDSKPRFDCKKSKMIFRDKICDISFGTIAFHMCCLLFDQPFGIKISVPDISDIYGKEISDKSMIDTCYLFNKKIKHALGIRKLIEFKSSHVWIDDKKFV
jgi:hypothetical protein